MLGFEEAEVKALLEKAGLKKGFFVQSFVRLTQVV
jgi:hypothetical protein